MKDHLTEKTKRQESQQVKDADDNYVDYYNSEHYVWDLAYLSSNKYYMFVTAGKYPLEIPNPPRSPVVEKKPEELEQKKDLKCRGIS